MSLGRFGAFYGQAGIFTYGHDVQVTRTSTGDAAHDVFVGDELVDLVDGGGGNDVIRGGLNADALDGGAGNDTFVVEAADVGPGETIDGGADFDRVLALTSVDLDSTALGGIEEIEFSEATAVAKNVSLLAGQFAAGQLATRSTWTAIRAGYPTR